MRIAARVEGGPRPKWASTYHDRVAGHLISVVVSSNKHYLELYGVKAPTTILFPLHLFVRRQMARKRH
jgi:hypothetical protein